MADNTSFAFFEAKTESLFSRVRVHCLNSNEHKFHYSRILNAHEKHLNRKLSSEEFNHDPQPADEIINLPGSFDITATLVLVIQDRSLLLGMKKRGFGEGYYNGFGGKLQTGETAAQAAARELKEESGIQALHLNHAGNLSFVFDSNAPSIYGHIFTCADFSGNPYETEEMIPKWFSFSEIPYDQMWADDRFWLPFVLEGRTVTAAYHFNEEKGTFFRQHLIVG